MWLRRQIEVVRQRAREFSSQGELREGSEPIRMQWSGGGGEAGADEFKSGFDGENAGE